jgi:hypothetical protein
MLDRDFRGFAIVLGLAVVDSGTSFAWSAEDERGGSAVAIVELDVGMAGSEGAVATAVCSGAIAVDSCFALHSAAAIESSATCTFSLKVEC